LGFVGTIEKLFILCPMPFYWMILMDDDDIPNCIWWATIALFVMILLLIHQYFTFGLPALNMGYTAWSASSKSVSLEKPAQEKKND
jgi:hypothetical protein